MKSLTPRYPQASAQPKNSGAGGNAPIKILRIGRIKAAVWENGADQRTFFNVTFARTYMDEQKQFHDADSFGRDDLLQLSKLADQAHTFVCERMAAQKGEGGENQ
ncbi:MAG TPA: hypothetical protein VM029_12965 [Opitutaceae bacterium]|nr:hypothetical protein [Opitutaceae bacterium]